MKRTKPPFRADHVGSLLRPPALKEAREQARQRRDHAADLKAVEDREIERVIGKQEEVGLQADHRRRIPPLVVASRFSLGARWRRKHVMDTGIAFAGGQHARRGREGHRQDRLLPAIRWSSISSSCRRTPSVTPKITIPAPSRDLWPAEPDADRHDGLSGPRSDSSRSRPGLPQGRARVRGRRLPLSAARRSVHRDAVRSRNTASR